VGVKPLPGVSFILDDKVSLAMVVEDLLDVPRVELISLPDANPFLTANVIHEERKT
jgi:uncharacterized protein